MCTLGRCTDLPTSILDEYQAYSSRHTHFGRIGCQPAMQAARRSPRSVAVDEIQQEVGLPHVTAATCVGARGLRLLSVTGIGGGSTWVGARALPVIDGTARYLAHFGLLV